MISFLKKEQGEAKAMSKGDLFFVLVLVGIGFGIYFYNKTIKQHAYDHYDRCQKAYEAKDYIAAMDCYDSAAQLHYRSDSLDSISLPAKKALGDIQFTELDLVKLVISNTYPENQDTLIIRKDVNTVPDSFFFISPKEQEQIKVWKEKMLKKLGDEPEEEKTEAPDSGEKKDSEKKADEK